MSNMLNPPDLAHTPVCITNRLIYPNGSPAAGERVRFIMRVYEGWLDQAMPGRVLGTSFAWTDAEGVWSTRLLPYTAFDEHLQAAIYVDVYELDQHVGHARIKPASEIGEVRWLRECLVPSPPGAGDRWQPISELRNLHDFAYRVDATGTPIPAAEGDVLVFTGGRWRPAPAPVGASDLASLTDVDGDAVDDAPDDAVLIKRNGVWTAVPLNLPALTDVDAPSLSHANDGDPLVWLSDASKWGIKYALQPIDPGVEPDPDNPMGVLVLVSADANTPVYVIWETGADPELIAVDEPVSHVYTEAGTKSLSFYYEGDPDSVVNREITVPPAQEAIR